MATDPLDDVLAMVADGRLTAEEAAPIIAALMDAGPGGGGAGGGPTSEPASAHASGSASGAGPSQGNAPGTILRLEITDGSRQVVSLRLPVAVGRLALDKVPGLSDGQIESVKEALRGGVRGPILDVGDGSSTVRMVIE